jgi:hypothetical protein
MTTCANCKNDAFYVYEITRDHAIHYCPECLPSFLWGRRDSFTLPTTEAFTAAQESALAALYGGEPGVEAPKPSSKKSKNRTVVEPVVEEVIEEIVVEDTPEEVVVEAAAEEVAE